MGNVETEEFISREAALMKLMQDGCSAKNLQSISDMPAADVAEVAHGRWILHDDGVFTCSECGNAESNDSYYCRLCGAKMDGGVRT